MTITRRARALARRESAQRAPGHRQRLRHRLAASGAAVLAAGALLATGGLAGASGSASPNHLVTSTPAGTKPVSKVVWAVYTTVITLDPIFTFTYPENTAVSLMCEALLKQAPTGKIEPGLATLSTPNSTTMVFKIRSGASFWDGHPVTATDVVYSLDRAKTTALGGFYASLFTRVTSITATNSKTVTISLKEPTSFLEDELSGMPGVVIEKAYAQKVGKNYGTPAGGIMCTGAYEYKSWSPGVGVVAVANPHYWQHGVKPLVKEIELKPEPTTSSLTSALLTGAIDGAYTIYGGITTLRLLEASSAVKVYIGPSDCMSGLVVSTLHGVMGSEKVRQALSLALNRKGIIKSVDGGAAQVPKWFTNASMFGYAKSTFERAYNKAPALKQTIAEAKKLVKEAGATGKTITVGESDQLSNIAGVADAFKAAGEAIGLNVNFKNFSSETYGELFTTPGLRKGLDGFFTLNYGTYSAPTALLAEFELPNSSENYSGFTTPKINSLLAQARSSTNPTQRARLNIEVEQITMKELPWIPFVEPDATLTLNSHLTGAIVSFSYMWAPWADHLGGKG